MLWAYQTYTSKEIPQAGGPGGASQDWGGPFEDIPCGNREL